MSGGADSTALLELLSPLRAEMGFDAVVLHVDHGLRTDSGDDAKFVAQLAKRHRMPLRTLSTKVRRRKGESIEMAARRVRLAFFEQMTRELSLDAIATGHHADDVAETFILRMARGSGPNGLAGLKRISKVGGITFIRPLLDLRDAELRDFLRASGIKWREDSTNNDVSILRNRVRKIVLPFLRDNLDAHIVEHLCKTSAILRGELERPAKEATKQTQKTEAPEFELLVEPSTGFSAYPGNTIGTFPAKCEMSRRALAGRNLEVRTRRDGDRIAPIGMGGASRKLQDVFVTAKTPSPVRDTLPLVADADSGEILWVPGYRIAASVAVESGQAPSWKFILKPKD